MEIDNKKFNISIIVSIGILLLFARNQGVLDSLSQAKGGEVGLIIFACMFFGLIFLLPLTSFFVYLFLTLIFPDN